MQLVRSMLVFAGLASFVNSPTPSVRHQYIEVRLVAERSALQPGRGMLIGLEMTPRRGWHGYWSNPGESGLAPIVKWSAPRGVHFGPLRHPAPTLMQVMGLTSYVHGGPHVLLAEMQLDRNVPVGTVLPIVADVTMAACSDRLCVPQKARLQLQLKAGSGALSPDAATLKQALENEPRHVPAGTFKVERRKIILELPPTARVDPLKVHFFPDENGYWNAAEGRVVSRNPLLLAGDKQGPAPARISGVLSDGTRTYRVVFRAADRRRQAWILPRG